MSPPEQLSLLVKGLGFRVNHIYELRSDDGGTELTITGVFGGVAGGLLVRMMPGSVRRDLLDELAAIKVASEEGPSD